MGIHFKEIQYGFEYGSAKITRLHSDVKKSWVIIGLETPKFKGSNAIQIYITKTGKVRFLGNNKEWLKHERE